jgi:hypothetical protein
MKLSDKTKCGIAYYAIFLAIVGAVAVGVWACILVLLKD